MTRPCSRLLASLFILCTGCSDDPGASSSGTDGAASSGTGGASGLTSGQGDSADTESGSVGTSGAEETGGGTTSTDTSDTGSPTDPPPNDGLPWDPEQLARVCERGNQDPVALRLCSADPGQVTSLASLYSVLGLTISPAQVALLGNSMAVSARKVSAINPRVLINFPFDDNTIGAVGYSRGEQMVELVGYDPVADQINLYALPFFQDCNDDVCSLADLYTETVESGWNAWTLYQDVDMENTAFDCLTCHEPNGPGSERLLLNRQPTSPWMHWFPTSFSFEADGPTQSTLALMPLFEAMHGSESHYGGIPIEELVPPATSAAGIVGEQLLINYWFNLLGGVAPGLNQSGQQHPFDTLAIEADIAAGSTETWDAYYAQVLAGERLPIPYHHHDITDPGRRDAVIESYTGVLAGAPPESLLDPSDVLSEEAEAALSFRPRADASAEEILHHICQRCHNDSLDQTLSRANFNAQHPEDLTTLQKQAAIARLMMDDHAPGKMPPHRAATLDDEARQTLVDFLSE
ncbi:MAG: hypothetical protein ACRBN8_40015 [Nannocystales bacterium]